MDGQTTYRLVAPEYSRELRLLRHEFHQSLTAREVSIALNEAFDDWLLKKAAGNIADARSEHRYVTNAARHKLLNELRRKKHECSFSGIRHEAEAKHAGEWEPISGGIRRLVTVAVQCIGKAETSMLFWVVICRPFHGGLQTIESTVEISN